MIGGRNEGVGTQTISWTFSDIFAAALQAQTVVAQISGAPMREATAVLDHTFAAGFITRAEYRRDWSNQSFFLATLPAL